MIACTAFIYFPSHIISLSFRIIWLAELAIKLYCVTWLLIKVGFMHADQMKLQ